ncbi:restriction endonuclease subunit S [Pseudomonas sp. GW6]
MTALLTDNLPLLAGAPNGIKKLRELILELAVRGKLVPQDPRDEPASELLKRIAEEKARLVAEGKIKRQKQLAELGEEEKLFELPCGWEWQRLDAISPMSLVDGDWIESKDQDPSGGVRLLQLADIGVNEFKDKSDRFVNEETFLRLNCTALEAGDILIARLPSPIGRACIFPGLSCKAITVVDVAVLRPLNTFCSGYVVNAINSTCFREQVEAYGKGATRFRIATGHLKSLLIPVPPLSEQHRIVAKVDELMALCDRLEAQQADAESAHAQLVQALLDSLTQASDAADFAQSWQRLAEHFHTLFSTESSIDALKQALLQLAVMGKLVPQDSGDEPASALLKRIAEEKARLVVEGKIKKQKLLAQIGADEGSSKVSSGWELVRFGQLIELISGQHLGPDEYFDSPQDGAIPYLTGPAEFGEVHPQPTRFTHERRATSIQGDILLTVKGSGVGKTNFVDQEELAISRQLMAIRPVLLDTQFTRYLLLSMAEHFQSKSIGIAIPGISREDVLDAPIGLPPLPEQHRIVAKVDQLMALCDQLKARLGQARQVHEQLANALVEQAVA